MAKWRNIYYQFKPFIPRRLQIALRRRIVCRKLLGCADSWPIDEQAGSVPEGFAGWPENKRFALVLTHDIDTEKGQGKCLALSQLERERGFCSSFNFVPERYHVDPALRESLVAAGFEVGVHGLNHDGRLYESWKVFQERAARINGYLKQWGAVGFRSPAMHHNLEWICELDVEYDMSTFDTDPFEPQPEGIKTIFPFYVQRESDRKGYVELPYTLAQDSTLFVIMQERNIDIWKRKLDWIFEKRGMALLNTHPDYMCWDPGKLGGEEYPLRLYLDFLDYVRERYEGQYWHALPKDVARFFRAGCVSRCD